MRLSKEKQNEQEVVRNSTEFAAHRFAIFEAYRSLVETLVLLGDALLEDAAAGIPCWVQASEDDTKLSHEDRAVRILQLITYGKKDYGNDGRHAETRFGFVAASEHTLEKVALANKAKQTLKDAIKALKEFAEKNKLKADREIEQATDEVLEQLQRAPIIRETLAAAKIARLHIKQSTRKIVVLDEQPLRLGFTVSRGSHVVRKLTRDKAIKVATTWHNKEAVDKLHALNEKTPVAQYQQLTKHVRCNIIYKDRARQEERPDQVSAYMPIFFPFDKNSVAIKHNGVRTEMNVALEDEEDRLPRASTRVDHAKPISPSLGFYHYLGAK